MISAEEISNIIKDSLYTTEELGGPEVREPPPGAAIGGGVMRHFAFNPERLENHREEVVAIIKQLPQQFLREEDGGSGGWSFLNLCLDKEEHQWGEHVNCDELLALSVALGLAVLPFPDRRMWEMLPGGMPYVTFRLTKRSDDEQT